MVDLLIWDVNNPLTQRIIQYMESGYKNNPNGLLTAAKLAAYDVSQGNVAQAQQTINTQQATIGELQRQTSIESGSLSGGGDGHADALAKAMSTGDSKDARGALRSMLTKRGILAE